MIWEFLHKCDSFWDFKVGEPGISKFCKSKTNQSMFVRLCARNRQSWIWRWGKQSTSESGLRHAYILFLGEEEESWRAYYPPCQRLSLWAWLSESSAHLLPVKSGMISQFSVVENQKPCRSYSSKYGRRTTGNVLTGCCRILFLYLKSLFKRFGSFYFPQKSASIEERYLENGSGLPEPAVCQLC